MAGCNGGLHNWSRSFNFRTVGAQLAKLSPMLLAKEKREAGMAKGRGRRENLHHVTVKFPGKM